MLYEWKAQWKLALCVSLLSVPQARAEEVSEESEDIRNYGNWEECCDKTLLNVWELCARTIKARCIRAKQIEAHKLCADEAAVDLLVSKTGAFGEFCARHAQAAMFEANTVDVTNLCALAAQASAFSANTIEVQSLCAGNISTDSACISNISGLDSLCVNGNIIHCTGYKAYVAMSVPTTYNLGDILNFDTIVDDPNGNILSGPTRYTVPQSGYYIATLGIGVLALTGPNVIAGIPTNRLEILVNGNRRLKSFEEFFNFAAPFQNSILSGLLRLNAGDVVTCSYRIFSIDPVLGVTPYLGTVTLASTSSTGEPFGETFFTLHYLSSDCSENMCPPCVPCSPASVTCSPQNIQCPSYSVACDSCCPPTMPV